MKFLLRLSAIIDSISQCIGRAVSWLVFLLVFLVTADVIMRYLFHMSFVALQELEWHLFALIFLLGGAYTLRHNGHVRVDVIYQRLGKKGRAWINLIGSVLLLFPGCYLVISTSIPFVHSSFIMHEMSPDPGGLPGRYILKAAIPVAFALMALQGISLLIHSLLDIAGVEHDAMRCAGQETEEC